MRSPTYISSFLNSLLLFILLMLGYSCISPYEADIDNEPELISIEASLVKGELEQTVKVSVTASLNNSVFKPVRG